MVRKPLDQASAAEIRKFAAERCGLDIHANANRQTAAQRLRTAWGEEWIEVSEETRIANDLAADAARAPEDRDPQQAFYRVRIRLDEDGDMDQIVQLGVNGNVLLVKRGEESEIRAPYYEVLARAVKQDYYHEDPQDMNSDILMREIPLYPFDTLSGPYFKDEQGEAVAA